MGNLFWALLALAAGAVLPLQAGVNSKLGQAVGSTIHSSLINFIIGTVALLMYVLISGKEFSWVGLKEAPLYAWSGGLIGAFFVTVVVLCFPALGPGLTFGLIVAGQLCISLLLEHFNILVSDPHPVNWQRIAGVILIVTGVVLIRKF